MRTGGGRTSYPHFTGVTGIRPAVLVAAGSALVEMPLTAALVELMYLANTSFPKSG